MFGKFTVGGITWKGFFMAFIREFGRQCRAQEAHQGPSGSVGRTRPVPGLADALVSENRPRYRERRVETQPAVPRSASVLKQRVESRSLGQLASFSLVLALALTIAHCTRAFSATLGATQLVVIGVLVYGRWPCRRQSHGHNASLDSAPGHPMEMMPRQWPSVLSLRFIMMGVVSVFWLKIASECLLV